MAPESQVPDCVRGIVGRSDRVGGRVAGVTLFFPGPVDDAGSLSDCAHTPVPTHAKTAAMTT
jgi:hypothetical protein